MANNALLDRIRKIPLSQLVSYQIAPMKPALGNKNGRPTIGAVTNDHKPV